ncbi:MAG: ATP synthase protein I, partial [uncultured Nocardioidaceae bacterium]
ESAESASCYPRRSPEGRSLARLRIHRLRGGCVRRPRLARGSVARHDVPGRDRHPCGGWFRDLHDVRALQQGVARADQPVEQLGERPGPRSEQQQPRQDFRAGL